MDNKIKITLVGSLIGSDKRQKMTAKSLGLRKLNASVIHNDTPDIRGKIKKLEHLLAVEEIKA